MNPEPETGNSEESPPLFKSWRRLYAIVIGELTLVIVLFYLFMKSFS